MDEVLGDILGQVVGCESIPCHFFFVINPPSSTDWSTSILYEEGTSLWFYNSFISVKFV